jgi:hypothetical protein
MNGLLQQLLLVAGLLQESCCHWARILAGEQGAGLLFDLELLLCAELDCHPLTKVHGAIVVGYIITLAKL